MRLSENVNKIKFIFLFVRADDGQNGMERGQGVQHGMERNQFYYFFSTNSLFGKTYDAKKRRVNVFQFVIKSRQDKTRSVKARGTTLIAYEIQAKYSIL